MFFVFHFASSLFTLFIVFIFIFIIFFVFFEAWSSANVLRLWSRRTLKVMNPVYTQARDVYQNVIVKTKLWFVGQQLIRILERIFEVVQILRWALISVWFVSKCDKPVFMHIWNFQGFLQRGCSFFNWFHKELGDENGQFMMNMLESMTKEIDNAIKEF